MEHLIQFPSKQSPSKLPNCLTTFHRFQERVPFVAEARKFRADDFYRITRGLVVKLQKDGPDAIVKTDLSPDIPGFLQSWLFFALLSGFLGEEIDAHDFAYENSKFISTGSLPNRLLQWKDMVEKESQDQKTDRAYFADRALNDASRFVSTWYREDDSWKVNRNLWLSFAILGETLTRARLKVLPPESEGWQSLDDRQWGESMIIKNKMQSMGWCPSIIHRVQRSGGNLSGLYVICCLESPSTNHNSCSKQKCMAHSKADTKFPLHTNECKERTRDDPGYSCPPFLRVEGHKIGRILEEGNIPLVYLDHKLVHDGGKPIRKETIEVRAYRSEKVEPRTPDRHRPRYIAISHVWSDGLGNGDDNALPLCQFLDLQDMVNKLDENEDKNPNTPFWLDTLCIPTSSPHKEKGIRRMSLVYEHSNKVLVLDKDLWDFGQQNGLEPLIRINLSKWMTRLWTLQEGSLSKNLFFRFRDGTLLSAEDIEGRFEEADESLHLSWLKTARIFNPTIRSLRNRDKGNKVAHIWRAVHWRKSHKQKDETICLSTLLDIDPQPLMEDPNETEEQKMCRFISMLDKYIGIPPGMIFLPGPKLNVEGFGWAPKTWMSGLGEEFPYPLNLDSTPTFLTRRGLLVQYPGMKLRFKTVPRQKAFRFTLPSSEQWYRVMHIDDLGTEKVAHAPWSRMKLDELNKLAIILCRAKPKTFPEIALLVSVENSRHEDSRHEVYWVHICCRVWISLESDRGEIEKMTAHEDEIWATSLNSDRRWCVDRIIVRSPVVGYTVANRAFIGRATIRLRSTRGRLELSSTRSDFDAWSARRWKHWETYSSPCRSIH